MKYNLDHNTRAAVRALAVAYEAYQDHRAKGEHARAAMWGNMVLRYQLELGVQLVTQPAVDFQQKLAGKGTKQHDWLENGALCLANWH